jgi:hypothetical protein
MALLFKRLISVELAAIASAGLALGALIGVGATSVLYVQKSSMLASELAVKSTRVTVLESLLMVSSDSPYAVSLLEAPPVQVAQSSAASDSTGVPSTADATAPPAPEAVQSPPVQPRAQIVPPKPDPVTAAPQQVIAKKAEVRVKPVAPIAPEAPVARSQSRVEPPAAVAASRPAPQPAANGSSALRMDSSIKTPPRNDLPTPEEVAQVTAKSPVVGVQAEKLGVGRLDAGGVYLRSGTYIRIGERFTSGERLLQVDVQNNRIVTSERQVLLFF